MSEWKSRIYAQRDAKNSLVQISDPLSYSLHPSCTSLHWHACRAAAAWRANKGFQCPEAGHPNLPESSG